MVKKSNFQQPSFYVAIIAIAVVAIAAFLVLKLTPLGEAYTLYPTTTTTTSSQLKLANGASCTVSSQCASNLCDQGICKVATGGSCTSNSQCANYNFCTNGVCTYIYCISHSQCTSGLCYGYGSSKYCLSTTTTLTIACSDSDADAISGIKPTIPGQVTQQNGVAKDKCGGVYDGSPTAGLQPVNTINEVFCSGRYGMNVTVVCPNSFHVCKLDPQGYAYCSTPTFVTK